MTIRTVTVAVIAAALAAGPAAAQTQPQPQPQTQPIPGAVGGDRDAHGCIPSAGYTYSTLRKSCIQMWEAGVKLMPLTPQDSASYAAYAVFASGHDGRKVEVFLYDHKAPLILTRAGRGKREKWWGEGYVLTRDKDVYTLDGPNDQTLYRTPES